MFPFRSMEQGFRTWLCVSLTQNVLSHNLPQLSNREDVTRSDWKTSVDRVICPWQHLVLFSCSIKRLFFFCKVIILHKISAEFCISFNKGSLPYSLNTIIHRVIRSTHFTTYDSLLSLRRQDLTTLGTIQPLMPLPELGFTHLSWFPLLFPRAFNFHETFHSPTSSSISIWFNSIFNVALVAADSTTQPLVA